MSVVAWIVLGLAAGIVAGRTANHASAGFVSEIALAMSACLLTAAVAWRFVDGLVLTPVAGWSSFVAMASTVTLLAAHHSSMAAARLR